MILINGRFLTQPCTGVQRFAYEICRELMKIRNDLVIVVPINSTIRSEYDLPVEVKKAGNLKGHFWEQFNLPIIQRSFGGPLLLNLASTASAFTRNQIVTHHDITYIRHPDAFSIAFIALYRFLVPRFLKRSRAVITVSEFSKLEISSFWNIPPQKITVVPNAIGKQFVPDAKQQSEQNPYFFVVGSLSNHKNIARLLEAFERCQSEIKSSLKIVGGGGKSFRTQKYIATNHRTEFLGRVEDAQMIELLQGARALVFPSLYEGFGIPPLEAQACGIPVIASDIPSVREVLRDSAKFFDPYDSDSIVQAIRVVDRDDELRQGLSKAGIENAKRFSWNRSANIVSALIDNIQQKIKH